VVVVDRKMLQNQQQILVVLVVEETIKQEHLEQEEQEILHHSHRHKVIMGVMEHRTHQVRQLAVEAAVVLLQEHLVLVEMPLPLREQAGLVGQVLQ